MIDPVLQRRASLLTLASFVVATASCSASLPSVTQAPPTGTGACGDTVAHDAPGPRARPDLSTNAWAAATPASAGIVAYFWQPAPFLRAVPPGAADSDKILWVSDVATGDPLVVTATRDGDPGSPVRMTFPPAGDPPGDYPSSLALPVAGCWHFALELGTVRASLDLSVGDPV